MEEKFIISGMSCSACSAGIERTLNKKAGIKKCEVFLLTEEMKVEYDENIITREEIISLVVALGYGAKIYNDKELKKEDRSKKLKKRFLSSLCFLIPLIYFSMGGMIGLLQPSEKISSIVQFVLSLVIIIINFQFFISGTRALIKRVSNMDTLVALGSFSAFIYSFVMTIYILLDKKVNVQLFYESAAMILTLITLGKWLEEKSEKRTNKEVENLIKLMPSTVLVERYGENISMPFSNLEEGDILIVKQGDYVPVDGVIIEGNGFIDRSALTGESMPIEVEVGSKTTGADVLVSGFIKVKAEKVGADTTLSKIVKMVKEAGSSKAPIQKTVDKIAGVFVPVVVLIALVTFAFWLYKADLSSAINYSISVLVISCPCSLGLATPVAVMAATGRGMALGVLYKNAEALQKTEKINCVLLDKTATLTSGKPKVVDFENLIGIKEKEIFSIAYTLESFSSHPIANCIREYALDKGGEKKSAENYKYELGKGAIAEIEGRVYVLGNAKLLPIILKKQAEKYEKKYSEKGKTVVFLGERDKIIAIFIIADVLKDTSKQAIELLKEQHIRVAMLTGDNERVAKSIAEEVGIKEYFAEALPSDKKDAVVRVREVGGFVAMVGDGINDSPALKAADVGIAMGTGTDVAIDSADIVIVQGNPEKIVDTILLSKATNRNIKQNLFWALFYNLLAIPIAAGVFSRFNITLNPMIAAACMSLSSLFVVGNALRLTRFKKEKTNPPKNREIEKKEKTFLIDGMMCEHCVKHVTKELEKVPGVIFVEVSLNKKQGRVELEKEVSDEILIEAIENAGYKATKVTNKTFVNKTK